MAEKQYVVAYERVEDGLWFTHVPKIPGCHTQGRTIQEARRRIREALGLYVEDAETVELVDEVRLAASARRVLTRCASARRRAEHEADKAREATSEAVRALTEGIGLSVRDAAHLLGISHQRVQQILRADEG